MSLSLFVELELLAGQKVKVEKLLRREGVDVLGLLARLARVGALYALEPLPFAAKDPKVLRGELVRILRVINRLRHLRERVLGGDDASEDVPDRAGVA